MRARLARFSGSGPGRFAVALLGVAFTTPLTFGAMRLNGVGVGVASAYAALVAGLTFSWFWTFLALSWFGYFPRRAERFVDRAIGPAMTVPIGIVGVLTANSIAWVPGIVIAAAVAQCQGDEAVQRVPMSR